MHMQKALNLHHTSSAPCAPPLALGGWPYRIMTLFIELEKACGITPILLRKKWVCAKGLLIIGATRMAHTKRDAHRIPGGASRPASVRVRWWPKSRG